MKRKCPAYIVDPASSKIIWHTPAGKILVRDSKSKNEKQNKISIFFAFGTGCKMQLEVNKMQLCCVNFIKSVFRNLFLDNYYYHNNHSIMSSYYHETNLLLYYFVKFNRVSCG